MDEYGLDGLIATATPNFTYLSDYFAADPPRTNSHRRFFAVLSRDPQAQIAVVVPRINLLFAAQHDVPVGSIRGYGEYDYWQEPGAVLSEEEHRAVALLSGSRPEPDPFTVLVEALEENGLTGRVALGVDELLLSHSDWSELERRLPEARLVDAHDIFRAIRMVKTPDEIKRLRGCLERTNLAMRETIVFISEGVPHRLVWQRLRSSMFTAGLTPRTICVGIGPTSLFSYTAPSDRPAARGDLVKFDHGGIFQGYLSDTARTGVIGDPTDKQRRYYEAVRAGQQAGCNAVRPGVRASELFAIIAGTIQDSGIPHYNRHGLGHGIGRETYDPPAIDAHDETVLEAGMVINVEAPYYELGFGGLQLEDTLLVTETGFEYLDDYERTLFEIAL